MVSMSMYEIKLLEEISKCYSLIERYRYEVIRLVEDLGGDGKDFIKFVEGK